MTTIDSPAVRVLFPGPLTNAEYFALPETNLRIELLDGKVVMSPSPLAIHQRIVVALVQAFSVYARRHGGEVLVAPMDVELSDGRVFQPDVLYVAPDGIASVTDHVYGPPDVVVEVLSPGTRYYDLEDKRPRYAEAGVREYWAVDPGARTVTVFENDGSELVERTAVTFGKAIPSAIAPIGHAGLSAIES
jgi:Uma2 family endonuclease